MSKGELKYKANFLLDLNLHKYTINANVRASMRNKSSTVALNVNGDCKILKGRCECPHGNWICSHLAATAIYANKKGISLTFLPNSWIAELKNATKVEVKEFTDLSSLLSPTSRLYQGLSQNSIGIFYTVDYLSCDWKKSVA